MSKEELRRVEVLARVRSKHLRIVDASKLLHVSYRQAKRLWRRYREEGAAGLKHRSVGRPSNHVHEAKFRKTVLPLVRARDDLGGGGCAARVDRTVRRPFGAVCGLEESVQAAGDATRTVAGRRADHAIWAHVREAGDRGDRGEFGPGQGTNRADARHAPRPLGEETAAPGDRQPGSRKRVSA